MSVGVYIVGRFVDDLGEEVYPHKMSYDTYMARYNFFKGE